MSKNSSLKRQQRNEELIHDFDFFPDEMESLEDDVITDMMHSLVDSSNHQQIIALELTKLIVEKTGAGIDEDKIFSTFQRASKVVSENAPLKDVYDKFNK